MVQLHTNEVAWWHHSGCWWVSAHALFRQHQTCAQPSTALPSLCRGGIEHWAGAVCGTESVLLPLFKFIEINKLHLDFSALSLWSPLRRKPLSWWNSLCLLCVDSLLPVSPDLSFFVWDISPCQGVGECVFFQEYKSSFAITASGVLVAQHSGSALQAKGME